MSARSSNGSPPRAPTGTSHPGHLSATHGTKGQRGNMLRPRGSAELSLETVNIRSRRSHPDGVKRLLNLLHLPSAHMRTAQVNLSIHISFRQIRHLTFPLLSLFQQKFPCRYYIHFHTIFYKIVLLIESDYRSFFSFKEGKSLK